MRLNIKVLLLAAVCVLGLAQILYNASREKPSPVREEPAAFRVEPPKTPPPSPVDVTRIILSGPDGEAPVVLERRNGGWAIASLFEAPADNVKVERFLGAILDADMISAPDGENWTGARTGTDPGEGILVLLGVSGEDEELFAVLGLRPEGSYDSVYMRLLADDGVRVLPADLRGEMGVWRNHSDAIPESQAWLDSRIVAFDPAVVESLSAIYPDHRLVFAKNESGEWTMGTNPPGGEWSVEGLTAWLTDLADFRVAGVDSPENLRRYGLATPTHSIVVGLPEGKSKRIAATPDHSGNGAMWVETSDHPGLVFSLPDWRAQTYFQRVAGLFPKANPAFSAESVRFIDIRRGGESVKLSRRPEGWRAVATRYPLHADRIERLVRQLSEWRALDFADPGDRTARPNFGGPLLEITINDGNVHQYRLGGRHPVFPWRYIQVDGSTLLALNDAEADALFPDFVEFLDLGRVFGGVEEDQITSLKLSRLSDDKVLIFAGRTADGSWETSSPSGGSRLREDEIENLVLAPLRWRVIGFGGIFQPIAGTSPTRLSVGVGDAEKSVVFLSEEGGEIPYMDDDGRVFLVDRTERLAWLGAIRAIDLRLEEEAIARENTQEAREAAARTPEPEEHAKSDATDADSP